MGKRLLPVVAREEEGLGADTIMDPGLAARYGVPYVHLAAFAIDIDRIRAGLEDAEDRGEPFPGEWPFAWEVFLTELYVVGVLELESDGQRAMLEELCAGVLESDPGAPPLGAQITFAVYDAYRRGALPESFGSLFDGWSKKAGDLVEELAPYWADPERLAGTIARQCLELEVEPPLSPPTQETLEDMAEAV